MKRFRIVALFLVLCLSLSLVGCMFFRSGSSAGTRPDAPADDGDTRPATEADAPETDPESEPESKPESDPESDPETVPETAPETDPPVVDDGKPKKYFTIRFDDGITQDARVMKILRQYGMDCCTFYVNTGLLGESWAWVGEQFGRPDVTHVRYTEAELKSGIYDGFDVQSHTRDHGSLKNYSDRRVTGQVTDDAAAIKSIFGYDPVGMAWPGGDAEWTDHTVDVIYSTTDIRYGICTTRTGTFDLPEYFLKWYPTCSFSDTDVISLTRQFVDAEPTEDMLFTVWCHGYELDLFSSWGKFETFIRTIAEAAAEDDSIVLVTNTEFYERFKDEIPSWK